MNKALNWFVENLDRYAFSNFARTLFAPLEMISFDLYLRHMKNYHQWYKALWQKQPTISQTSRVFRAVATTATMKLGPQ